MADISKITLPNGSSYNFKDATARNSKTNTSVLPNDGGEIKTKFRMSQKGFTNGATWYYPLCKLPQDNDGNYASAILSGRVGGWISNNMSSITSMIWNRGTTGIALLDIAGSATAMSGIWGICDIVVYTNSDTTDTVYLKCNNYFTFDVDIELFQSGCTILYNGNYVTTTPSGTLAASASTSTKRAELINGKLYVAGNELVFKSAIPTKTSQLTNDSGFKTTDNNTTYSLSKSGSTITLTGSDGSKTSVTDTDTNTWRGIQNNLTSDSTTDSLSAAQGKVLKGLVDGKAASSHTHTKSQITDFPTSLPANGGNADTIDGRHCGRIATFKQDGKYWNENKEDINDAYLQWDGSTHFKLRTFGGNLTAVDYATNADTVDSKHASDFATASHKQAYTSAECTAYTADENTMGTTPAAVKKAIGLFEPKSHTHTKSQITDFPTSLPANGGNATTVNSHTVNSDVPANAKFTDTVYTLPAATSSTLGGVKIGSNITNSSGTISLTKANVTAALGYTPPTTNTTYGVATQSANGLMSSADKTKLDSMEIVTDGSLGLRKLASGTADATTTNCPAGCWYGKYS